MALGIIVICSKCKDKYGINIADILTEEQAYKVKMQHRNCKKCPHCKENYEPKDLQKSPFGP